MPTKPGRKTATIPPAQRRRLHTAARHMVDADDEMRAAVRDAKDAGGSIRAIADEIGRSTRTIQNWLKDTAPSP
ncbi:helix-turn-helix domain-containing protein [Mycobacteroides abscessus]|uniref:helix-turn-helix domain-containing protein n=1 Tax=Mycobacteroides abscessus TaxID=36809 RepID=UPI0019274847|nr:helix-turn-helix domain-containing protein [Mycobacteroides abscessus]